MLKVSVSIAIYLSIFTVPTLANEVGYSDICEQSIAGLTRDDSFQTGTDKIARQFSHNRGSGEINYGSSLRQKLLYSNFDNNARQGKYQNEDQTISVAFDADKPYHISLTTYLIAPSKDFTTWPTKYKSHIEAKMATICNRSHVKDHSNTIGCSQKNEGPLITAKVSIAKPGEKRISCIYNLNTGYVGRTANPNETIYRINETLAIKHSLQASSPNSGKTNNLRTR